MDIFYSVIANYFIPKKVVYYCLRRAQNHCKASKDPEIYNDGQKAEGMIMQWSFYAGIEGY